MTTRALRIVKRVSRPSVAIHHPTMPTSTAPRAVTALPVHLTRFIGRDRELDALVPLLADERLVTLTGAGGSGKTRLALALAMRAAGHFDRTEWVDLASLAEPDRLAALVAAALRVADRPDTTPECRIADALVGARTLVVLDNCEHLIEPAAALVESLLRTCPDLTVLATSREALGIGSETAWLVPPLVREEAVQLFVERARSAYPAFVVTEPGAAAVAEICRRLDGIPLAIELAAARVRVLAPEQIAERLDDAFRLLSSGSRTAIPRHRTLRATMEWSVALLGVPEQVLLRRLAVFAGGFRLEDAEAICADHPLDAEDILDGISMLVDKSLVMMESGDGAARYRLLETVRQYARERLEEAGELEAYERRHALRFLAVIEELAPQLVGGAVHLELIAMLRLEQENVRAATVWSFATPDRAEHGLRLAGALFWLWYAFGSFRELRGLADRALALPPAGNPLLRGRALVTSALTALAQGDYPLAIAHFEQALPILRTAGVAAEVCAATAKLGAALMLAGDFDRAIPTLDNAMRLTQDCPPGDLGAIFANFWRGWAAYLQGDLAGARDYIVSNLVSAERARLPTTRGHSLAVLARIDFRRGDVEAACQHVAESLEIETMMADGWGTALALDAVAIIAAARGRHDDAVRLLAGTDALRERLAMAIPGVAPAERAALLDALRERLGAGFAARWAEGAMLDLDALVTIGTAEAARHTAEHRVVPPPAAPAPRRRLRVRALGALQVALDDRTIEAQAWGSSRPRELLAYLLLHPDGRSKEQVGLAFWPDASPAQLRNSFHVTLHRLRRALGAAEWVTLEADRYRVDRALVETFDVWQFETDTRGALDALRRGREDAATALEGALAHYHGDLLDGEPVGDWHLEHRERLQRLFAQGMTALGAHWSAAGRPAKAAETYQRLLARDPLHEEAVRGVMEAQAELGERAQALRAYRRFVELLRREVGAEPSARTTALAARVQRGAAADIAHARPTP